MATDTTPRARRPRARGLHLLLLPCLAALSACAGTHDLSSSGCLPLRAPTQVVLAQEAGLYSVRDAKTLILTEHPRKGVNAGTPPVRTLPPGTRLAIERLQQAWGFDTGKGRISAFGTLPGGEAFEYGWGAGTTIGRAPWEPATVPNLRTVACGK